MAVPGAPGSRPVRNAPEPPAEWVRVDDEAVREVAKGAVGRGRGRSGGRLSETGKVRADDETCDQLQRAVGDQRGTRLSSRLADATRAFRAERYTDAARILRPVAQEAPGVAPVRELYGLVLYRQGRWAAAIKELEAFRQLTGSTEQHPVLADCYRARRQWTAVDELWEELRQASPSAELVTEGRIVASGALADRGDLAAATRLLGAGFRFPHKPKLHHLRRAYALADLHERAGDLPRARELFGRVVDIDPDFADALGRARALR